MTHRYVLRNGVPVPEPDLMKWAEWMEQPSRRVLRQDARDGVLVSTVFLGLDYNFAGGPPLLYETMVFREGRGDECERYHTREEALAGHERMLALVFGPQR